MWDHLCSQLYACQCVAVEDGKVKRVALRLDVKDTTEYRANLAKHEALAKKSLTTRMHDTMNDI